MVFGVSRLANSSAAATASRSRAARLKACWYGGGSGPGVMRLPPTTEYEVLVMVVVPRVLFVVTDVLYA